MEEDQWLPAAGPVMVSTRHVDPTHVLCRGVDLDGEPLEIEAKAKESMILQHERDHLDGILYPMRMADISKLAFVDECFGAPAYPLPIRPEDYMV